MKDLWILGACLRVFLRPNWRWPYVWRKWGFYAFGVGPVGFMFWTRADIARGERAVRESERRVSGRKETEGVQ